MNKIRITAPFYTVIRVGDLNILRNYEQPDGSLYARGKYVTGIKAKDLPEHYIKGTIFHADGYISVLGIKDIVYEPNYRINHMHNNDYLYISYAKPIRSETDAIGHVSYHGYDALLWGGMIVEFIRAIRKWNSYDIEPIAKEVKKKEAFFLEKYPEEGKFYSKRNLLE